MKIIPINASDRDWTKHRYVLWFGAYGTTHLMVWANSLDDALDECVDWLVDNAPGYLCDDMVTEEYKRGIAAGLSEDDARDGAETDMTCAGNCGNYIASWEWGVDAEDPSRANILSMQGRVSHV